MLRFSVILITLNILFQGVPVSMAQEPAGEQKQQVAWPVAAAWIDNFDPQVLEESVQEHRTVTGDQSPWLFDISKTLSRRFTSPVHIPSEKGVLIVFGPKGFERLDFERVFDAEGARQVLEEFNGQWISANPMQRPNYEVICRELGSDSWEVEVLSLSWRAVIPDDPTAKITYTKESRKFLSYQFRLFGGFLFTARKREILESTRLDLLPDLLMKTTDSKADRPYRRLGALWFNPAAVPEPIRAAWFEGFQKTISPSLQVNDVEDTRSADARIALLKLKRDVLQSAVFDLEPSTIRLETDESGTLYVNGFINARNGSGFQKFCDALTPNRIGQQHELDNESDLNLALTAAVPTSVLSVAGSASSGDPDPLTVDVYADLRTLPNKRQAGQLSIKLSDDRLNFFLRDLCLPHLMHQLGKLFSSKRDSLTLEMPSEPWTEDSENEFHVLLNAASSVHEMSHPPSGEPQRRQHGGPVFRFRITRSELRRLRRFADSTTLDSEVAEEKATIEDIAGQITADHDGVSIRIEANHLAVYELLAYLSSRMFFVK